MIRKVLAPILFVSLAVSTAAQADFELRRTLELAPGGELVVDAEGARISVTGGATDGAQVLITSPRSSTEDRYRFRLEGDGRRAEVEVDRKGLSWFNWGGDSIQIEIKVPLETSVRLETSGGRIDVESLTGEVTLDTSGGRIEVYDVRGNVDAHTSGGSITAEKVVGDLKADTSGGAISVDVVTGDIRAETSGGSISIEEVGGRVHARSSGGPVSVRFAQGNAAGGDLSTSGGGVTALVDPSVGLDVDASTSGGRVTLDLGITVQGQVSRGAVRGRLNGGGAELRLRSSGGGVRLRSL